MKSVNNPDYSENKVEEFKKISIKIRKGELDNKPHNENSDNKIDSKENNLEITNKTFQNYSDHKNDDKIINNFRDNYLKTNNFEKKDESYNKYSNKKLNPD